MRMHLMAGAVVASFLAALPASWLLAPPRPAWAQSGADKAAAEQLFAQARKLMKQGKHAEACPRLEASLELDPALGTLLNLAVCVEELGQLASAWAHYREAENLAERAGQAKRAKFARQKADNLEPRLARLVVTVADGARVPGLAVARDGTAIDAALFGTAIYVDAGPRTITATAPGHREFTTSVTAVDGSEVEAQIPALEPLPPGSPDGTGTGPDATGPGDPTAEPGDTGAGDRAPGRTRRVLGLATAGTGIVALAFGAGFGVSARSRWQSAFDDGLCDRDTLVCTPEGQSRTDAARTRADVSTLLVATGAALAAAGVVLYLTAPSAAESATQLTPGAGPGQVGVTLSGRF